MPPNPNAPPDVIALYQSSLSEKNRKLGKSLPSYAAVLKDSKGFSTLNTNLQAIINRASNATITKKGPFATDPWTSFPKGNVTVTEYKSVDKSECVCKRSHKQLVQWFYGKHRGDSAYEFFHVSDVPNPVVNPPVPVLPAPVLPTIGTGPPLATPTATLTATLAVNAPTGEAKASWDDD